MSFDRDVNYAGQPVLVYMDISHVNVGTGPHVHGHDWLEPHYEYRCPQCGYVESHKNLVADPPPPKRR